MVGERFGRLTVVASAGRDKFGRARFHCVCDCGEETSTLSTYLRSGDTKSCGCLQTEAAAKINRSHGKSRTPEYQSWFSMISRCTKPTQNYYELYGGRGIRVCDRWMKFENFLADMGPKPTPKHSIDRINNNGNYEPSNCRWASIIEQANNTRENRFIKFDGQLVTHAQAARLAGISYNTFCARFRRGWEIYDIMTRPVAKKRRPA